MSLLSIDKIESAYDRTLGRIGIVKSEIDVLQQQHVVVPDDTVEVLETLTARAVALARLLSLEYDSEYDA